nr:hypothetical protein [Ensifer aridi]
MRIERVTIARSTEVVGEAFLRTESAHLVVHRDRLLKTQAVFSHMMSLRFFVRGAAGSNWQLRQMTSTWSLCANWDNALSRRCLAM